MVWPTAPLQVCSFLILSRKENKWGRFINLSASLKSQGPFFKMLKDDTVNVLKKWFIQIRQNYHPFKKRSEDSIVGRRKCGVYRDGEGRFMLCPPNAHTWSVWWNGTRMSKAGIALPRQPLYLHGKVINGPAMSDLDSYSMLLQRGFAVIFSCLFGKRLHLYFLFSCMLCIFCLTYFWECFHYGIKVLEFSLIIKHLNIFKYISF